MIELAIAKMWDTVKDVLYITREDFVASLDGYAIVPFFNDAKEMYGVVVHRGPAFHFILFGPKWQLTKAILRQYPGKLIEQYGYAETFTPVEDMRQQRFNKRVGFVETKRDEQYVHFRIERMPVMKTNRTMVQSFQ